jgi:hypothetical protein
MWKSVKFCGPLPQVTVAESNCYTAEKSLFVHAILFGIAEFWHKFFDKKKFVIDSESQKNQL